MTETETILKLIENTGSNDHNALDKIDALVWCWLNGKTLKSHYSYRDCQTEVFCISTNEDEYAQESYRSKEWAYTTSRDALKAIRPEGWNFNTTKNGSYFHFELNKPEDDGFYRFYTGDSATEELAELEAIIKTIEYERKLSANG